MAQEQTVAYFSMEIGLESGIPTYSGGLGVLAGDTIRSAADLQVPLVAVSLLHRKGYFFQKLDARGWQTEEPYDWVVEDYLEDTEVRTTITIEGRTIHLRAWRYDVTGSSEYTVPVFLMDSDLPENSDYDRTLTHYLYGGDKYYRLCQEIILGIGGVKMLHALGYKNISRYHLNEGHASLLTVELFEEITEGIEDRDVSYKDIERIRKMCVFTTHTPVPAGHDEFPMEMVNRVLGGHTGFRKLKTVFNVEGVLNMTYLALNFSHYINGVAKKHGEVSRLMFANYAIDAITNGVHAMTWVSEPFREMYDEHIPGWRQDSHNFRYALSIPNEQMWKAHQKAKKDLLQYIQHGMNVGMDVNVFTIGFARRATAYKRADLVFSDLERLKKITRNAGPFQIVYAGKAHPNDQQGKEIIKRIWEFKETLKNDIKIVYLPNYDIYLSQLLTSGVDVWLNTPQPPLEASGTSGMKATMNGVPSFSILDGWWIEGCIEGVTGWSIGEKTHNDEPEAERIEDAASLYDKLENVILPLYYHDRNRYIDVMRHTIALNGSFFNTHRMVMQYVLNAYFR